MALRSSSPVLAPVLAPVLLTLTVLLLIYPTALCADSPPHSNPTTHHHSTTDNSNLQPPSAQQHHDVKPPAAEHPPVSDHHRQQQQQKPVHDQSQSQSESESESAKRSVHLRSKKEKDDFIQNHSQQLEDFQRQVFDSSLSPFSSLMQGLFSGLPSSLFQRPKISFGKTDDGQFLVAKLSFPDVTDEQKGAKRNIAYALTSANTLQVRINSDSQGTRTSSSNEYQLPNAVAKEDMTVIPAADGSIHVKMRILSDAEAQKLEREEQAPAQKEFDQAQARTGQQQGDVDGNEDDGGDNGSLRMPGMNEILDQLLGSGSSNGDKDGGFMLPIAPLVIRFRPFGSSGNVLGHRSTGGTDDNSDDDNNNNDDTKFNALFEELPSAAHSTRCHDKHHDDLVQLRKCLCDVTPVKTRAVCYSRMVAKSIRTARDMDGLHDFASQTKNKAYDCVNGTEDETQCMERVASSVVHFLSRHDGSSDGHDDTARQLKEKVRQALEREEVTASHFSPSGGLLMLEVLFGAVVLSVMFWVGMVYAMRRGWFGNRTGGLLSHLSSVMTQRSISLPFAKGGGTGSGSGSGTLPTSNLSDGGKHLHMNGVHMSSANSRSKSGDKVS